MHETDSVQMNGMAFKSNFAVKPESYSYVSPRAAGILEKRSRWSKRCVSRHTERHYSLTRSRTAAGFGPTLVRAARATSAYVLLFNNGCSNCRVRNKADS